MNKSYGSKNNEAALLSRGGLCEFWYEGDAPLSGDRESQNCVVNTATDT